MTDIVVYEVDQESFAPLLLERPELAESLAAILSARMPATGKGSEPRQQRVHSKFALLRSIQEVFRLKRPNTHHHI
jgi:hypothetical protein